MKKALFVGALTVTTVCVLSAPKVRMFVKERFEEFMVIYREREEELYKVFVPSDEEVFEAKTRRQSFDF